MLCMNSTKQPDTGTPPEDEKKHRCPYCERMFVTVEELSLHVLTRHTQGRIIPRPQVPPPTGEKK